MNAKLEQEGNSCSNRQKESSHSSSTKSLSSQLRNLQLESEDELPPWWLMFIAAAAVVMLVAFD